MDLKYEEILKHLEKQDELLMDASRSLSHEWQKLKAEEDMLMHAFSDFMEAQGRTTKKKDGRDVVLEEINRPHSKEVVNVDFVGCPNIKIN
ncbi:unnamed protein product [Lactuca virosa]|uniref:Uncharacterized protein n=1 Tax=Lactuca virosa TaxID=75947 RepID=A0AAU9MRT9_9ASTR|nr:unnamed protein product [Lactuca virosa]